jgi:hypothetical protein
MHIKSLLAIPCPTSKELNSIDGAKGNVLLIESKTTKILLYELCRKDTADLRIHNLPISPVGIEKSCESI